MPCFCFNLENLPPPLSFLPLALLTYSPPPSTRHLKEGKKKIKSARERTTEDKDKEKKNLVSIFIYINQPTFQFQFHFFIFFNFSLTCFFFFQQLSLRLNLSISTFINIFLSIKRLPETIGYYLKKQTHVPC